jgi:hypothetical protein
MSSVGKSLSRALFFTNRFFESQSRVIYSASNEGAANAANICEAMTIKSLLRIRAFFDLSVLLRFSRRDGQTLLAFNIPRLR